MQLFEHVKEVLSKNESFCKDGKLFKNNVVEAALKLDTELLTILLKDDTTKKHFFTTVEGVQVFDKVKFQQFVSNKQFLPDSYTTFKNKIGLTANGEYLTEANEVVLDFPYKDCVLEGGQTKEDQKRKEIFWNETLASDEIDRLFEPKVLTNWKKYDKKGEHVPTSVTDKDNLMVKGNNLLALHSLRAVYKGKVNLIYIDPPYNTGNDSFRYNDSFNHSSWLTFMINRLRVARELLADSGSIFIQIDDFEDSYLKVLCDMVFGEENFRNKITWKRRGGSANPKNRLNNVTDYILWYSKTTNFKYDPVFSKDDENTQKYIKERFTNKNEDGRLFMKSPLQSPNPRPNLMYDYKGYKTPKNGWSIKRELMEQWDKEGKLWFPDDKEQNINRKVFLDEYQGQPISSLWTDISVINPMSKERSEFESGQKPEALIHRFIQMVTNEGDLVMDFFMGSGTTAAVALKTGRRFIGIEQLDYILDFPISRVHKVVKGDDGAGISEKVNWKGGGSFVYAELAENAASYISKIEALKNSKEAVVLWHKLKEEPFISYRVSPSEFDSNIDSFEQLELDDQKKLLISTIDKNHLYINYADIEDKTYNISDADKKLNLQFYNR